MVHVTGGLSMSCLCITTRGDSKPSLGSHRLLLPEAESGGWKEPEACGRLSGPQKADTSTPLLCLRVLPNGGDQVARAKSGQVCLLTWGPCGELKSACDWVFEYSMITKQELPGLKGARHHTEVITQLVGGLGVIRL